MTRFASVAVVLAIAALIARVPLAGFSTKDWLLIAAITFVAQLLGHTLFNLVVSTVGPTIVSLAILLEVPGSLIVALILLHQAPPLLALPGMAAVVVGGVSLVTNYREEFNNAIREGGVDGLIKTLQSKNKT